MKKKLLVVILFCLSISGIAMARQLREVINIDLNVEGDANAYQGKAAYDTNNALYDDGISTWRAFAAGGWGKGIGSPRSHHLTDYNDPNNPAIYASQVWIGDRGVGRTSYRDTNYSSPGLMNDGFQRTSGEPNIFLWGRDAYTGKYDIYVYGNGAGNIKKMLYQPTTATWDACSKPLSGGVTYGQFTQGGNYVVFPEVNIVDANCVFKTLYVDGVKIGSGGNAQTLGFSIPQTTVTVAADSGRLNPADSNLDRPWSNGFNGDIDEFAIYSGVLSDARIAEHKNATPATYEANVMADNPILYLRFDDATSNDGDTALDTAGLYGYDGTYRSNALLGGAVNLVAGYAGTCASFNQGTDANGASVNVTDPTLERYFALENVTIECWIRTSAYSTADLNEPRIFNHNDGGNSNSYGVRISPDNNDIGVIGGGNVTFLDANNPSVTDGQWHHIVATYKSVPGGMFIAYDNKINGLQLVRNKDPRVIKKDDPNTQKWAAALYDVIGERSGRTSMILNVFFGPSLARIVPAEDLNYPGQHITRIERREFGQYDVYVDKADAGKYSLTCDVSPASDGDMLLGLYVDDVNLGTVKREYNSTPRLNRGPTTAREVNLTPGYHTVEWMIQGGDGASTGGSVLDVNLAFVTADDANYVNAVASDCNGVKNYGLIYEGDLNKDCRVDTKDLDVMTEWWLECNDPRWQNCQ